MSREAESTDKRPLTPWLTLVGLGADGAASLSERARTALESAELVFGAERQLALVRPLLRGACAAWPSPLAEGIERLLARRGRPTCVLASGDPFFYGIGATLSAHVSPEELICHPAPSSLSLAAARLGWPLQDAQVLSLHGRALHTILPALAHGRRLLVLSWNRKNPAQLAELLRARGFGGSRLVVLESLGAADERIRACTADAFDLADVVDLNLVALELSAAQDARVLSPRGLPDSAFEHDGQLTKRDVRAVTLAALAPMPGELLWDIGAGAGSIAIEWMLVHPSCRAVAVEQHEQRATNIARNAQALGVPGLSIVRARAPEGLDGLASPDAIFVGGGGAERALIERCRRALRPGGRLVVNAVSLETEAQLIQWHGALGGELVRVSIEHAAALGSMKGWRAAMPVVQWRYRVSEVSS